VQTLTHHRFDVSGGPPFSARLIGNWHKANRSSRGDFAASPFAALASNVEAIGERRCAVSQAAGFRPRRERPSNLHCSGTNERIELDVILARPHDQPACRFVSKEQAASTT